jgi:hypothetical protein
MLNIQIDYRLSAPRVHLYHDLYVKDENGVQNVARPSYSVGVIPALVKRQGGHYVCLTPGRKVGYLVRRQILMDDQPGRWIVSRWRRQCSEER